MKIKIIKKEGFEEEKARKMLNNLLSTLKKWTK